MKRIIADSIPYFFLIVIGMLATMCSLDSANKFEPTGASSKYSVTNWGGDDTNLSAYYDLDEFVETDVLGDYAGTNDSLSVVWGGSASDRCQITNTDQLFGSGALYCDSSNNYGWQRSSVSYDYGSSTEYFTYSVWIKPTSAVSDVCIWGRNNKCEQGLYSSSSYTGSVYNNPYGLDESSSNFYDLNKWVHFVMVFDKSYIKFYKNATSWGSVAETAANSDATSSRSFSLGTRYYGSGDFRGYIDDLCIWDNIALTDTQIQSLYNNQTQYNLTCFEWWDCETEGTSCPSGGTTPDTTPPVITINYPVNGSTLAYTTTSVDLNISTDEDANCTYNFTTYSETDLMSITNGTEHGQTISVSSGNEYHIYYNCTDASGNEAYAFHNFSVEANPCSETGGLSYVDFAESNNVELTCGFLHKTTLSSSLPTIQPSTTAVTYKVYDDATADLDKCKGGVLTATSSGEPSFTTVDGVPVVHLNNSYVEYDSSCWVEQVDDYCIVSQMYVNTTSSNNELMKITNTWSLKTNLNGNGMYFYDQKNNKYIYSQNNATTGWYDFKICQQAKKDFYEVSFFINDIEVARRQSDNSMWKNAYTNPIRLGNGAADIYVSYFGLWENETFNELNGTKTQPFDELYPARVEFTPVSYSCSDCVLNLTFEQNMTFDEKNRVVIIISGVNTTSRSKDIPVKFVMWEQDGTNDTSGETWWDVGKPEFDTYDIQINLGVRGTTMTADHYDVYKNEGYTFGIEPQASNSYASIWSALRAGNWIPIRFLRWYQNDNNAEYWYVDANNFTYFMSEESSSQSQPTSTPQPNIFYAKQCNDDGTAYTCMKDEYTNRFASESTGILTLTFHDALNSGDWQRIGSYFYNESIAGNIEIGTINDVVAEYWLEENQTELAVPYMNDYNSYVVTVLVYGDAQIGNLTVSLGDASTASGNPDTNFTIWNSTDWMDAEEYYSVYSLEFICRPTESGCEPTDQDATGGQSIYKICNNGTASGDGIEMWMNNTVPRIYLKCDDSNSYASSVNITATPTNVYSGVVDVNQCVNVYCWADYDNPTAGGYFDVYANVTG